MKKFVGLFALLILVACGGGGDSEAVGAGTAEGFWGGTSSNGYKVGLVVLENAETWGLYATGNTIRGAFYGNSTGKGTAFSISGSDLDFSTRRLTSGATTGTVSQKVKISGKSNVGVTFDLTYDATYDQPAVLADIVGSYNMTLASFQATESNVQTSISSAGDIVLTKDNCTAAGKVTPRSSRKNIFNLSLTLSGVNCGSGNGGTVSGIFILDATTTPKSAYFFTLTPTKQDGIIGIGSKTQRS